MEPDMSDNLKEFGKFLIPSGVIFMLHHRKNPLDRKIHSSLENKKKMETHPFNDPSISSLTPSEELEIREEIPALIEIRRKIYNQLEEIKTDSEYTHTFPREELEGIWSELDDDQNQFESDDMDESQIANFMIIDLYQEIKEDIDDILKGDLTLEDVIDYYQNKLSS